MCGDLVGAGPGDRKEHAIRVGGSPITSADGAIAWMGALDEALPAGDGLGCFSHMYLGVVQQIAQRLWHGFFTDPVTMTHLGLVSANLCFAAGGAWQPLLTRRAEPGIEPAAGNAAGSAPPPGGWQLMWAHPDCGPAQHRKHLMGPTSQEGGNNGSRPGL